MPAAVQLLTGWQAASESLRTDITFEVARTFAFPPENVLTLVIPGIFGDLVRMPYWGRWTVGMSLFIGTAPFLLVIYALVHAPRSGRRYLLALTLVSLVLVGYYTPLFRFLYDFVPGFGRFRGIYKFTHLTGLFLALLTGVGLNQLLRDERRHRWPTVFAFAAALALVVSGWTVSSSASADHGQWSRLLASIHDRASVRALPGRPYRRLRRARQ